MTLRRLPFLGVFLFCFALPAIADESRSGVPSELQGVWTVSAAEQSGRPLDEIRGGRLTIEGSTFELQTAAGNAFQGELRVDATAMPGELDLVHDDGSVWRGIYTVSGDLFRLIYVDEESGADRPAAFATSQDIPGLLVVLSREQ